MRRTTAGAAVLAVALAACGGEAGTAGPGASEPAARTIGTTGSTATPPGDTPTSVPADQPGDADAATAEAPAGDTTASDPAPAEGSDRSVEQELPHESFVWAHEIGYRGVMPADYPDMFVPVGGHVLARTGERELTSIDVSTGQSTVVEVDAEPGIVNADITGFGRVGQAVYLEWSRGNERNRVTEVFAPDGGQLGEDVFLRDAAVPSVHGRLLQYGSGGGQAARVVLDDQGRRWDQDEDAPFRSVQVTHGEDLLHLDVEELSGWTGGGTNVEHAQVDEDTVLVWSFRLGTTTLSVVDLATRTATATHECPEAPDSVVLSPDGTLVAVGHILVDLGAGQISCLGQPARRLGDDGSVWVDDPEDEGRLSAVPGTYEATWIPRGWPLQAVVGDMLVLREGNVLAGMPANPSD